MTLQRTANPEVTREKLRGLEQLLRDDPGAAVDNVHAKDLNAPLLAAPINQLKEDCPLEARAVRPLDE